MGITEKNMESTIVYYIGGHMGILQKKMETTMLYYVGVTV